MYKFSKNTIVGHRGCDEFKYSNTLEAFEKAISCGAEMIEFDVRRTVDGVMIVHHDEDIFGEVIRKRNWDFVRKRGVENGLDILTLAELAVKMKGRIQLVMELKETGYEKEAVTAVQEHFKDDDFIVISFNDESISAVKRSFPGVAAGLLLGEEYSELKKKIPKFNSMAHLITRYTELFPWKRVKKAGADFIAPYHELLHLGMLKNAQNRNIPVFVWTVDNEAVIRSLLKRGSAAGIISNKPGLAIKLRKTITGNQIIK